MDRSYYYLCASMPMLTFGTKPPMSDEDFIACCSEHLRDSDLRVLKKSVLAPESDIGRSQTVLKSWNDFEVSLRNEIVISRAKNMRKDSADYIRGEYVHESRLAALITEAVGERTPLEVEKRMDLARWDKLEDIGREHYFDLSFLIVYYLKLQLVNKWYNIVTEKGEEILEKLLNPEGVEQ